jgi:transcriptional regulator GlxA family with amidase domain
LLAYIINLSDNFKKPIWQVMENNYMYNLNIGEFAQISSRSLASFKRDFFDYYKTTPGKWLTRRRLERARLLLHTTKLSISDVVFSSGFENTSHFSRIFKEKFGLSPLQFRKNQSAVA